MDQKSNMNQYLGCLAVAVKGSDGPIICRGVKCFTVINGAIPDVSSNGREGFTGFGGNQRERKNA
jgi:hypothetical protein